MQHEIAVNKKLAVRKQPTQSRSQKTVERILTATRKLLTRSGGEDIARLTTNHIAKEAGISVGSLYQYFPNKEAILFGVYKEMLDQIYSVISEFKDDKHLSLGRDEFFDRFNRRIKTAEAETALVIGIQNAMKEYPALADADRKHAELIGREIAGFMKHFGSKWPMKKLERLGLYVYYINEGTWRYLDHVKPPNREARTWMISTFDFVMSQCFED